MDDRLLRDMSAFEESFMVDEIDDDDLVRHMIRLQELAGLMFAAICDHFDDLPDDILNAADDWCSYLLEVAEPNGG